MGTLEWQYEPKSQTLESRNPNGHARMNALEFPSNDPWSVLKAIDDLEQEIGKRVECIAIDEGQFVSDLFLSHLPGKRA